jgi:hypothetical protein
MRISAAVTPLLLVMACGGAQPARGPRVRDCADYAVEMRAPLARLARAADEAPLGGTPEEGAVGARELAARVGAERDALARLTIDDRPLARAHHPMVAALGEMGAALEYLGDVLARRDEAHREEARARLGRANRRWAAAVDDVRAVCPLD